MSEDAPCPRCGHPSGPHVVAAPGDPLQGGIMLCQDDDCSCFATFGIPAAEPAEPYCGFCQSAEHRPYLCPNVRSRADFETWRTA